MLYTLVTGASSGIGEEFARQFAALNHHLILVARSESKLNSLAEELKKTHQIDVKIFPMDLSKSDSANKLAEACEKEHLEIDYLINDAGVGLIGKFDDFTIERIEEMINLNILTLTKLVYLFLPHLKRNKGTILNLASQVAFAPAPYMAAYAATKAYVLNFTEGIREEYQKEGIHILALCPGPTYTRFFEKTNTTSNDINFKFRPPKDVVEEAISALKKDKAYTVVGWENKLMIFLFRFLPRTLLAKFSAKMVKDGENKQKAASEK